MDFHSLTRRELQTLCKKNKIPANITNVAMADALKALEIVEGLEEFMQQSQSETAQSSIESPRSEVTSPYVPPTAGRSTRRRNVGKEEPATVNPTTRTRRTTRKTLAKDADESQADQTIETPAMVGQKNRKNGQMASVCRKMDSQLKECATPAVMGVISRRRIVKDESTVKRVYSTRRSARLAERNEEMVNEEAEASKEDMDLKEGVDDSDQISVIAGVDASTIMEENSESKDDSEAVSAQNQDISIGEEIKSGPNAEEDACFNFETEAKADEEKCDNTEDPHIENTVLPLRVSNEVRQSEIEVENTKEMNMEKDAESDGIAIDCVEDGVSKDNNTVDDTEEMNTEQDIESEEKAAGSVENVVLDSKDNLAVDELSCDPGFPSEIRKEFCSDEDDMSSKDDINSEHVPDFIGTLVKFTELQLQPATKEVSPGGILGDVTEADLDIGDHLAIPPVQLDKKELEKTEILQLEEPKKAAAAPDAVPSEQLGSVEGAEDVALQLEELEKAAAADPVPSEQLGSAEGAEDGALQLEELEKAAADPVPSEQLGSVEGAEDGSLSDFTEHIPTSAIDDQLSHTVQPVCLTPSKISASKKAPKVKRMTGYSDNKENIGSGSKLVVVKDRVKIAKTTAENVDNLNELSLRKLSKMFKEKLQITKKLSKNDKGNEALPRPALQALPENRQLADETQD